MDGNVGKGSSVQEKGPKFLNHTHFLADMERKEQENFPSTKNAAIGLVAIIKEEARVWILNGANKLAAYLPSDDAALL